MDAAQTAAAIRSDKLASILQLRHGLARGRFLRLDQFNAGLASGQLVEEEINGGNPAVPGDDEIRSGVCWRIAGAARYPLDPPAIAQFLGLGNRLISEVGMSRPDSACDAIDLVAATVDTLAGIIENGQLAGTEARGSEWLFPGEPADRPILGTSVAHAHSKVCRPFVTRKKKRVRVNRFSEEFVLHSLRHTCLTRLGEAGADAFTIMKLAGHSSVTVSQRYVHPTPESVERAFDRLETLNRKALERASGAHSPQNPPQLTIEAT